MNGVKKEKEVSGMDEKKTRPDETGGKGVRDLESDDPMKGFRFILWFVVGALVGLLIVRALIL